MDLSSIGLWVQILRALIVLLEFILQAMQSGNPAGLQRLAAAVTGLEELKNDDPMATEYFSSAWKRRS